VIGAVAPILPAQRPARLCAAILDRRDTIPAPPFSTAVNNGREYVLNLYTKSRRTAFSYRAPLPTTKDEWTEVAIPLEDFIPTSFGRQVQGMGPVEPEQITSIGFMLADKKPGKFRLNVGWVKVRPVDESDAVARQYR
jgi:hypothetical protein